MIYFCCDQLRRTQLVGKPLNGIDYLEVLDHDAPTQEDRQRSLFVHFINALTGPSLTEANVRIEGGERISKVTVVKVTAGVGPESNVLTVEVNQPGDFSIYTLRLVQDAQHPHPPDGIDPMFASVDFSFKVECPSDFDCRPQCVCPPRERREPEIDYLAKDYATFRRLMLDRMSALMPQWRERNPADLGVALVEALAYVGDYLSYQQDAVATEAYLGTARKRVSVRRHARLVDYSMHDGCNARAWVQVQVTADVPMMAAGTRLYTRIPGQPCVLPDDPSVREQAQEVFETMEAVSLCADHNVMKFHTWGDQRCCLPRGATQATLQGYYPNVKAGDVLIFEEVLGPDTGRPEDADPTRRQAVRLTDVQSQDAHGNPLTDLLTTETITEIAWAAADALQFPLCVSATTDEAHGEQYLPNVSVARGNIVLADHGRTIAGEPLGVVPSPALFKPQPPVCDRCRPRDLIPVPPRFRPPLKEQPLTCAVRYPRRFLLGLDPGPNDESDLDNKQLPQDLQKHLEGSGIVFQTGYSIQGRHPLWSLSDGTRACLIKEEQGKINVYELPDPAATLMRSNPRAALPAISLHSTLDQDEADWLPRRDLLESGSRDAHFVVETETDGVAGLRFGDNTLGQRPEPETSFSATYRVGNGVAGNVGAESIAHLSTSDNALAKAVSLVRNPLPAQGGIEPESMEEVRQYAPAAFRTQERAVTEADYAAVTERHPEVQRAVATFRWTGSWYTVFITVDRTGGLPVDGAFKADIRQFVEQFRMAGYDLEVDGPRFVSLEIEMHVCVKPDYFGSDAKNALLEVFSNRVLPDGRLGVFHPDNFTFGQTVYLSRLIAAAQAVAGVASVQVVTFQRQGTPETGPLDAGELEMGRLEIARCDNDPNYAERGVFSLTIGGGK